MSTFLGFLRAVNLGAKRVFPKDDIRRVVECVGFEGVATHLNTGNVRFETRMRSRAKIEQRLEAAFADDRGFEVPTIVFAAAEFRALADTTRLLDEAHPGLARHYVYLLRDELSVEQVAAVESASDERGWMRVRDRAAHALLSPGYQDGRVDPLGAVPLLGVTTNRTANVVRTLADRWC